MVIGSNRYNHVINHGTTCLENRLISILASQKTSCLCLEGDDDDGQFQVSLFLQLGQNPCPEEHLTLTNTVQVRIQVQVFYLEKRRLIKGVKQYTLL